MRITDIKLRPASKYLFVQVETDKGITGLGEAGVWGFLDATKGVIDTFKKYLVGKDPFNIEDHWNYLYRSMYFRGSIIMSALSAIDMALWDIKGKALDVPVYQLLGGKVRSKARCYDVAFAFTTEDIKNGVKELKEAGFNAMRVMITKDVDRNARYSKLPAKQQIFSSYIQHYVDIVKAAREAGGKDFDLLLDVHRSMTYPEVVTFAREVEKYRPYFIEDPIPPDNFEALGDVARQTTIPIANGERNINIQEFEMQYSIGKIVYCRPDMAVVGGITAGKKIASIAEAHYGLVVPHNPLGPVATAACLQLAAAIPNFAILEFPSFYRKGNESEMMKKPFTWQDGYMDIPDRPGLGIELIDNLETEFPVNQRSLSAPRMYDSSVTDI